MAFKDISTMAKVAIGGGIVSGGLLIAGITWQGEQAIDNVTTSLDNMKQEFVEALNDNEFLRSQFNELDGLYSQTVEEANATIDALEQERNNLYAEIEMLRREVPKDSDVQEDTEKIQAEITRLESELNKANQQVAELEAYAKQLESEVQYTPINQSEYTAEAKAVETASIPISNDAMALNPERAQTLADNELWLEEQFSAQAPINITGVSTYTRLDGTTEVSLVVEQLAKPATGKLSADYTEWFTNNFGGSSSIVLHTEGASGTDNVLSINAYGMAYRAGGF